MTHFAKEHHDSMEAKGLWQQTQKADAQTSAAINMDRTCMLCMKMTPYTPCRLPACHILPHSILFKHPLPSPLCQQQTGPLPLPQTLLQSTMTTKQDSNCLRYGYRKKRCVGSAGDSQCGEGSHLPPGRRHRPHQAVVG